MNKFWHATYIEIKNSNWLKLVTWPEKNQGFKYYDYSSTKDLIFSQQFDSGIHLKTWQALIIIL